MPESEVHRQPEEDALIRTKPLAEQITPLVHRQIEEEELQAKELTGQTSEISPNLESRINATKGGGQPLPESDRAFFEPRFSYDFSQVRAHTDAEEYGRGAHGRPIFDVYVTGTVTNPPSDLRVCLNDVYATDATDSRIVMPGVSGGRRYYFQRFFQTDRQDRFHIRVQTEVPAQQSRMEANVFYAHLTGTSVYRFIDLYWEEAGGGHRRLSGVAPEVSF